MEWVKGDLRDAASLIAGAWGCEVVIHVAAELSPGKMDQQAEVNIAGTERIVAAALTAGARRLVFTSSVAALGRPAIGSVGDEETPYDWPPGSLYQESKRDGESAAMSGRKLGLEVISLNPSLVLGPGAPKPRLARLMRWVRSGLMRLGPPGGVTVCDVRDVAAAHVAAIDQGLDGERYVLGGPQVRYVDVLAAIARALKVPEPLAPLPSGLLRLAARPLSLLPRVTKLPVPAAYLGVFLAERYFSSEKARRGLGYSTRPLDGSVEDMIADLKQRGLI